MGNGNDLVAGVSGSDLRKVSHGGQGRFSSFVLLHFAPYSFCLSVAASQSTVNESQGGTSDPFPETQAGSEFLASEAPTLMKEEELEAPSFLTLLDSEYPKVP